MTRYSFRYETGMTVSSPVSAHSWLLRALPRPEPFQRLEWDSLRVTATLTDGRVLDVAARSRLDAFGSRIQFGCILEPHVRMDVIATGAMAQSRYRICGTAHGMYFAPTALTAPSKAMLAFLKELKLDTSNSAASKAYRIAEAVHGAMSYAPGSTCVDTSAAQAFEQGRGVCQDYAHITLALLRASGVAARYVCGFLSGEGATHAWVEWFDSGVWLALDPTHGTAVERGCIKVAHGRDSADCPVNRGIFTGRAWQTNTVSIKVDML